MLPVDRSPNPKGPSVATLIHCPLCQHPISIKDPRPGRFKITCVGCSSPFALTVPEGPGAPPVVATLAPPASPPDKVAARAPADPDETVEHVIPPRSAPPFPPPVQDDETIDEKGTATLDLETAFQPPRSLGGYRVGRPVGQVVTGSLFEGRRKSTGLDVRLAIMRPRWSSDAAFVARFAREVYAAEQVEHPNLLPPKDFNIVRGFPLVASDDDGSASLSDPKGREGLDRSMRAAAILHAARGLKAAHEQGIYHRNLWLARVRVDPVGLVRLADVGIGLTPATPEVPAIPPIELAGPPGSPMPPTPEPPSAAFVREDIAGLGRCLESLIGGSQGGRALTPGLASLVRRMVGDEPEARFKDMGAVVRAMEAELGVVGPFAPSDEEAAELESCARAFDEPPLARLRPILTLAFAGFCALFVALALLFGKPLAAVGVVGFAAIAGAALVAVRGAFGRDVLLERARELAFGGGSWGDALMVPAALALAVGALASTGLLGIWIFLGVLAAGLATAYHFALERPVEQARVEPLARARALIQGFRRRGVDEDSIRRFACRQAGPRWEEFFEALFGYEAMRDARRRWGLDAGGRRRPRFAPWRDPIVDAIDARVDERRRDRDRVLFQAIEERGLEARGINLLTARRKGRRIAEAIVQVAYQFRRQAVDRSLGLPLMDALNRVALRPDDYLTASGEEDQGPPAWKTALGFLARVLLGPRTRFLAGSALLAGCLLWMYQNSLISGEKIKDVVATATADQEKAITGAKAIQDETVARVKGVASGETRTKDLELEGLSPDVTRRVDGFGLGVAGLILVLSSFYRGVRMAAFAVPGALVAAVGPHLIEPAARTLGPASLMAMAVGAGLFALGVVFGRTRD